MKTKIKMTSENKIEKMKIKKERNISKFRRVY